tara:strand:+ start:731 stop:985 length:255 start_codon:yes stop_codon:yes gene_type:complete
LALFLLSFNDNQKGAELLFFQFSRSFKNKNGHFWTNVYEFWFSAATNLHYIFGILPFCRAAFFCYHLLPFLGCAVKNFLEILFL